MSARLRLEYLIGDIIAYGNPSVCLIRGVASHLERLTNYNGVQGTYAYDANGSPNGRMARRFLPVLIRSADIWAILWKPLFQSSFPASYCWLGTNNDH